MVGQARQSMRLAQSSTAGGLSGKQKAAIIVRLLLSQGSSLPVTALPDHLQAALAEQMSRMRIIDRETLQSVIEEFVQALDQVGLSFPADLEQTLQLMDGHITPSAASRLRRMAGVSTLADPWERITALPVERLQMILEEESIEVSAITLSKLPVAHAAQLLERIPGPRARQIAFAVSMTSQVAPETVHHIGHALIARIESLPIPAFEHGPVQRVGAILNNATQDTRSNVLAGLEAEDASFAEAVRKALFTFEDIPFRLNPRDVPQVLRTFDQQTLITALAITTTPEAEHAAAFLFEALPQRLADTIRDQIEERGPQRARDTTLAAQALLNHLRDMVNRGEVSLSEVNEPP